MDRDLTTAERSALEAMLAVEVDGIEALREQVSAARVTYECPCGCPTVGFTIGAALAPRASVADGELSQASVADRPDGLVLFVKDGYLGPLEYWTTLDAPPATFPPPEKISPRA